MKPMRKPWPIPLTPRQAVVAAIAAGVGVGAFALWRKYVEGTYLRFDTMFGEARVYQVEDDRGTPVRLLEVGGIVQSGTYLDERYTELVFEYLKRYDLLFDELPNPRRICVLGCGGYDYPEHLIACHPNVTVDAVEIDPAITSIARRYFYLDRLIEEYETEATGRLNLICEDALAFLLRKDVGGGEKISSSAENRDSGAAEKTEADACQAGFGECPDTHLPEGPGHEGQAPASDDRVLYDAIVNDTFDGGTPPSHLTTLEFARAVHARLVPGGLFLTNIVSALEGPGSAFLNEQVALFEAIFDEVRIFPCATDEFEDADNVIVVAKRA